MECYALATPSNLGNSRGCITRICPSISSTEPLRCSCERIGSQRLHSRRTRIARHVTRGNTRSCNTTRRPCREATPHSRRDRACTCAPSLPRREGTGELSPSDGKGGAFTDRGTRVGRNEAVLKAELIGPERSLDSASRRGVTDFPCPEEPVL